MNAKKNHIKLLIIFSLLFFSKIYSQTKDGYLLSYNLYNLNTKNIDKKFSHLIKSENDTIKYTLNFDGNSGLFTQVVKIDNSQIKQINMNDVFAKSQGNFYFDNSNQIIENKKESFNKSYVIISGYNDINWDLYIDNSNESILGYNCKKAVYKKIVHGLNEEKIYTITAWYSDDFSDNIAPFGLMGLNGLVLKVNFNNSYEVILDQIIKQDVKPIKPFNHSNKITLNDYNEIIKSRFSKIKEIK
ncbi:GLPGLI family protein [Empedobacter brevis]|uniref:GLPGLI family protein n=1 Tax=Empedobacter brevis TaxID=247 RepID=UPI00123CAF70|nr:GLPGLI family protein [Empedobacter brevis]QES91468.1 GLPGLI family protein [Empedobacter brevis]